MPEFRVTFGSQYAHEPHPLWPPAHPDGWLTIEAPNERAARETVLGLLGTHWCNLYPADAYPEDDVMYPRGELGKIVSSESQGSVEQAQRLWAWLTTAPEAHRIDWLRNQIDALVRLRGLEANANKAKFDRLRGLEGNANKAVKFDREQMIDVLVYHQRANIESCRCGWSELGRSHPAHVVDVYERMKELEAGRE